MAKSSRNVGKEFLKVLNVMSGSTGGGAERFFERISIALNKESKFEVRVVIRKNKKRTNFFKINKIKVYELNFYNKFDYLSKSKFVKICKEFKPNLIVTWMNRASLIIPEKKYNNEIRIGRLGGFYKLKNYINCDYLIANTEEIRKYIIDKGWDKNKVFYLPNFVQENSIPNFKRKDSHKIILGVGRFHENKNFETVIKAIEHLPEYKLWLVGDGFLKSRYISIAKKYKVEKRLKIFSWEDKISKYYNSADVVVCSSIIEPLGNVILEAWSHKVPIIAANVMGPANLIKHKVNGLKFQRENIIKLIECVKILEANKGLKQKIIKNGFEMFTKYYSEKNVTKKYINFFYRVNKICADS